MGPDAPFDHAMANPPWHDPDRLALALTLPATARAAPRLGLLDAWVEALAGTLRRHGTLTLVAAASAVPPLLDAFSRHGLGSIALLPLWPRAGTAAKLVLLHGMREGRGAFRLLPGLVLHEADGRFSLAAEAVLRDAGPVPLAPVRPVRNRNVGGTAPTGRCTLPVPLA